jgi:hypothetical protein
MPAAMLTRQSLKASKPKQMTAEEVNQIATEYNLKAVAVRMDGEVQAVALTGFRSWAELDELSLQLDAEIGLFRCPPADAERCVLAGDKRAAVDFSFRHGTESMQNFESEGLLCTGILLYTA